MFSSLVRNSALGVALLVLGPRLDAQKKDVLAPLDAYVAKVMKDWKVPGIAIAIVRNDSVVHAKGYGVRKLGDPTPVDANTLFAIGSSSKAFTAALIGLAVDEGKMRWDDPVAKFLPAFQLHDAYASRDLTIRDALSHRSGLARGDFMWYSGGFERDEILRRTRYLKPSWGLRSRFGYQNLMYLAAGQAVAHVQGASWDDLIRTRIFAPLGMTASGTSTNELSGKPNVSQPHADVSDTVQVIPWKNIDNIAPAGSINSSVNDMTKWLRFQLGHGKFGGKQIMSTGNLDEMWRPNTHMRFESALDKIGMPGANLAAYGLGWFLQDFGGNLAVHHGGNIDGFSAMVAMIPDQNLGIVVLSNMDGSMSPIVLWAYIADLYTRAAPRDWSADYVKIMDAARKQGKEAEAASEKSRVAGTSPSLPIDKYAGVYSDSLYGDINVTKAGDKLRFQFGSFAGGLEHWHYDSFRAVMDNRRFGKPLVRFIVDGQGKASTLKIDIAPESEFRLTPPEASMTPAIALSPAEMAKYTGAFKPEALPLVIDIQIVNGQLRATVPGQPTYTLVPVSTTRFRMAGENVPEGFYIDYELDGNAVKSVTLVQPAPQPTLKLVPVKP